MTKNSDVAVKSLNVAKIGSWRHVVLFLVMLLAGVGYADAATSMLPDPHEKWKYKVKVGQFNRLKVLDNVNVVYRNVPDSTGYIVYQGIDDFADSFIFTVNNGMLKIQVTTEDVNKPDLPTLYVYSDFLTCVENSSNFTVTVESPAPCPDFKAVQIGNGKVIVNGLKATEVRGELATGNGLVQLSGECDKACYRLVGTGAIHADMLKADDVKVRIAGSGMIQCWAEQNLIVKGVGSTKIYYKGNPAIKKSLGGHVFPLTTK